MALCDVYEESKLALKAFTDRCLGLSVCLEGTTNCLAVVLTYLDSQITRQVANNLHSVEHLASHRIDVPGDFGGCDVL